MYDMGMDNNAALSGVWVIKDRLCNLLDRGFWLWGLSDDVLLCNQISTIDQGVC
jgi:hypothetical protein